MTANFNTQFDMRKFIYALVAIVAMLAFVVSGNSQTNTPVVLRTLGLSQDWTMVDCQITDYIISKKLTVVRNVDKSKSVKTINAKGKPVYTDAPDWYSYEITTVRNELNNAGTYLPNLLSMDLQSGAVRISTTDPFEIKMDRINPTSSGGWIGAHSTKISQLPDGNIKLVRRGELGESQNVIQRILVKKVGDISYYKNATDYLNRPIPGDTIYNEGVPSSSMRVKYENRVIDINLITRTTTGSGLFTSSSGTWTGGVKTITGKPVNSYIPVAELPSLFGQTMAQLEAQLFTETYCSKLNPVTHVTSVSAEITKVGGQYKLTIYCNGFDIATNNPKDKITSYGLKYPTVNPQIRLFNGATQGGYGVTLSKTFTDEPAVFSIQSGTQPSFNDDTNTLTYDLNKPADIWGIGMPANDNGKKFNQGECFYKIQNGQLVPKKQ